MAEHIKSRALPGYMDGIGIGGWLTNYKRLKMLPGERINEISIGDREHFDTYITHDDVKNIADMGFDHIRLAFDQLVLESFEEPGTWREEGFSHIDDFLSWCETEKVNVILNLHKAFGCVCDFGDTGLSLMKDRALQDRFVGLWLAIERRYHGRPAVFELMNEVAGDPDGDWDKLARRTVAALRAVDPDRVVMVGCPQWSNPAALSAITVSDDPNVVYTFHCYAPHCFTHQRAIMSPGLHFYNRTMPWPGPMERYIDCFDTISGWHDPSLDSMETMGRDFLFGALQPAADFLEAHPGVVLTNGEFGTIRSCPLPYRINWFRDVVSFCKEHGIPRTAWNYLSTPYDSNRFSLVDDDNRKILSRELLDVLHGR